MSSIQKFQERLTGIEAMMQQAVTKMEQASRPAEETIIDDVDLCQLLNVSKRTTATWRAKKMIKHAVIIGKIYYFYSDVLHFIKKYSVQTLDGSLKIKLKEKRG